MTHILSFPGLGIPAFELKSVAFSLFGHPVAWYGIIVTLGILTAFFYALFRAKRNEGISEEDTYDIGLFTVIFGIIGARAYFVLTNLDYYTDFYKVIAVWEGGLAIYGGIIAGVITIFAVTKIKKISSFRFLDATAPGVMLGQAIGRWGNFINAEAHGVETDLPWRMGIYENGAFTYYHPTFLYESLWNILGFLLVNFLYRRKKYNGQIVLFYVTWYGFGRMLIEGLRTDSLYIFNGSIRISQLVGFLSFFIGLTAMIVCGLMAADHRKAREKAEISDAAETDDQKIATESAAESSNVTETNQGKQTDSLAEASDGLTPEVPKTTISESETKEDGKNH